MSGPRGTAAGWRERQERDPYVRRAREEGYRSRAAYKLEELLDKAKLSGRPDIVVDLGAAPGAWSQYVVRRWGDRTRVIALDILPMDDIPGVEFVQGDFTETEVLRTLEERLGGQRTDLVMSDMAPNISGNRSVDQPKAMYLAELALDLACETLREGGAFICKVFQGEGFEALVSAARGHFRAVRVVKPKASRPASREVYLLARNYRL
ncbi:MAG: RlmE family RNA methyltransferase [Gammaproteobacteria bacterium]